MSSRLSPLLFWPLLLIGLFIAGGITPVHASVGVDDLVKCPETSSVYWVGEDGKRYVFPNEKIYFTHESGFEDVKTISCDDLASLPIGGLVPYQAGTRLVKIPSVRDVYFVEPNGVLRPIPSEEYARELFGDDWNKQVDDLSEAFFPQYKLGEVLEEDEIPEGFLFHDGDEIFRVNKDGDAEQIDHVLDEDDRELYRQYAREDREELEERMEQKFEMLREDVLGALEDFFERLESAFHTVNIDESNFTDTPPVFAEMSGELAELMAGLQEFFQMHEEFDDIFDDDHDDCPEYFIETFGSCEETEEAFLPVDEMLINAEQTLDEAMQLVHEEEWTGKRTDGAWDLIDEGWDFIQEAWDKLEIGFEIWDGDNSGAGVDLPAILDFAKANAAKAHDLAGRVLAGEGIEAVDPDEWDDWHKGDDDEEWCDDYADCWWEDDDYDDDDYWDDQYDEWYEECVSRGECVVKDYSGYDYDQDYDDHDDEDGYDDDYDYDKGYDNKNDYDEYDDYDDSKKDVDGDAGTVTEIVYIQHATQADVQTVWNLKLSLFQDPSSEYVFLEKAFDHDGNIMKFTYTGPDGKKYYQFYEPEGDEQEYLTTY